jgi:hypothetical protein
MELNKLILGDNLEKLKTEESETVKKKEVYKYESPLLLFKTYGNENEWFKKVTFVSEGGTLNKETNCYELNGRQVISKEEVDKGYGTMKFTDDNGMIYSTRIDKLLNQEFDALLAAGKVKDYLKFFILQSDDEEIDEETDEVDNT